MLCILSTFCLKIIVDGPTCFTVIISDSSSGAGFGWIGHLVDLGSSGLLLSLSGSQSVSLRDQSGTAETKHRRGITVTDKHNHGGTLKYE